MTLEQFKAEKNYRVALSVAKTMLGKGLINEREYRKINSMLIDKYRPIIGVLGR